MLSEDARDAARRDAEHAIALAREQPEGIKVEMTTGPAGDLLGEPDAGRPGTPARRLTRPGRRFDGLPVGARISDDARRAVEAGLWDTYGEVLDQALQAANVALMLTFYAPGDSHGALRYELYVVDRDRFPEANTVRGMREEGVNFTWELDVHKAFGPRRRGLLDRFRRRRQDSPR